MHERSEVYCGWHHLRQFSFAEKQMIRHYRHCLVRPTFWGELQNWWSLYDLNVERLNYGLRARITATILMTRIFAVLHSTDYSCVIYTVSPLMVLAFMYSLSRPFFPTHCTAPRLSRTVKTVCAIFSRIFTADANSLDVNGEPRSEGRSPS